MIPGTYVRMTKALKGYMRSNGSHEHVEEFGDCIGIVVGLVDYGNNKFGPEINVRWAPSNLQYGYIPEYLETVRRLR